MKIQEGEKIKKILFRTEIMKDWGFPCSSVSKESACSAGNLGSISGSGRSSGEGNGSSLQYSCLENLMDRGAKQATVCGVAKSQTRLNTHTHTHTHTHTIDKQGPTYSTGNSTQLLNFFCNNPKGKRI